jgi:hypothetical protein
MQRTTLAVLTAACAVAFTAPAPAAGEGRIVDACAYITGWEPARLRCYEMWMRWCPLIADADARARCIAELTAGKAGAKPPAAAAKKKAPDTVRGDKSPGRKASGSSRNPETGVTTTSVRNADGSRTVTVTGADGKVIETHQVPANPPASRSVTDRAPGVTTTSVRNEDGSRTVTRTGADGKVLSSHVVPAHAPAQASATDAAGTTVRSVRNADGSRTVTTTDAGGRVLSTETVPASRGRKAAAPAPEPAPQAPPAPAGARTMSDFCAHIGDAAAKDTCYHFGNMVRTICRLIRDSNGHAECLRITAQMPDPLGPYGE